MKKSKKILVFIMLLILLTIVITPNFAKATQYAIYDSVTLTDGGGGSGSGTIEDSGSADVTDHPSKFKPNQLNSADTEPIVSKANKVIGAITTVGVVVSVVATLILGLKFMMGSVAEKAEYKKSMVPYIIGIAFLFTTSIIVKLIASLVTSTSLSNTIL